MTEQERLNILYRDTMALRDTLNMAYETVSDAKHPTGPYLTGQMEAVTFILRALDDSRDWMLTEKLTLPEVLVEIHHVLSLRSKGLLAMADYLKFITIPRAEIEHLADKEEGPAQA